VFKYQDRKVYEECTEKRGLFEKNEYWSNFDPLYLGNSNSQTKSFAYYIQRIRNIKKKAFINIV
jgi:hypothetical protein